MDNVPFFWFDLVHNEHLLLVALRFGLRTRINLASVDEIL